MLALFACNGSNDDPMSEVPVREAIPYVSKPEASKLQLDLGLPLAAIDQALGEAIPENYISKQQAIHQCKTIFKKELCGDLLLAFEMKRGAFAITPVDHSRLLHVEVPLAVSGKGAAQGELGSLIGDVHFELATQLGFDLGLQLDAVGCPVIEMKPSYQFTSHPRIQLGGRVWIEIDEIANTAMAKALTVAQEKLKTAIHCDRFKEAVKEHLKFYTFPVPVPHQSEVHWSVTPVKMGVSRIAVKESDLRFTLLLEAITEITEAKPKAPLLPNLNLTTIEVAEQRSSLSLSLPIHVDYDRIEDAIHSYLKNKEYKFPVAFEEGTLTLQKVKIYPVKNDIAIGVHFRVKVSGPIPDVKGWVYLLGTPVLDSKTSILSLTQVRVTRRLNSDFWTSATDLFQDRIEDEVKKAARVDLTKELAAGARAIAQFVEKHGKGTGYEITLDHPELSLSDVVVSQDLILEPKLKTSFELKMDLSKLVKLPKLKTRQ